MAAKASVAKAWSLLKEQALLGKGGHSALLDLSARMAGFQHWHEASERGKAAPAGACPMELAGSPRAVKIELVECGARLGGARGDGVRVDFSILGETNQQALSAALAGLALAASAPPFWSPQAWRERALGLARLLPEAQEAMAALGEPSSIAFLGSWEGISRVRTLMDKTDRDGLGSRWIEWARPWHSVFAPEGAESRLSYQPMAQAWVQAQALMTRAEEGQGDWRSRALDGSLAVDPGDGGAWIGLAKALLRSEGLTGEIAGLDKLSPEVQAAGLRWFPPAS